VVGPPHLISLFSIATDMNRLGAASAVSLFLIILRAGLLAGIGEELLFRGALYGWLRSRWSARVAIAGLRSHRHRLPTHRRPV
jgi:membrane protease YdiL (CAAX protease family)